MYVVVDKQTKKIIHINPAPLIQHLKGKEVYFDFDPESMEMGKADISQLPEHFKISADGLLREFTLQEKYDARLIRLSPIEKIVDDQIVTKSLAEQVSEGTLKLAPTEKIVGDEANGRIVVKPLSEQVREGVRKLAPHEKIVGEGLDEYVVAKSLSEQVAEGLLELLPSQKIVGEGATARIVEKTLSEQVAEGLLKLAPTQKIVGEGFGEEVVDKTKQELLDEGVLTLADVEEDAIRRLRAEVAAYYDKHKTPNNYRLDELARQKASFSYQFLDATKTNKMKKDLLAKGLIYPDNILEEIVGEIEKVQEAYTKAMAALKQACEGDQPVEALEAITLQKYLTNDTAF